MKTTIELDGYEIVISNLDGTISVSAMKSGETLEEFEIQVEDSELQDEVQDFEDFEDDVEVGEADDDMEEMESDDDMEEMESDDDMEEMESEDEDEVKLESFQSFINKRGK